MSQWKKKLRPFAPGEKPERKKPRKLEDPIHTLCYNWLDCNIDGMVYHCPNGLDGGSEVILIRGKAIPRAAIMWTKLEKLGARAGVLDLTLHWRGPDGTGRTAYLEIKSAKGPTSKGQRDFMADLTYCGIPFRVCRSLADAQTAVREIGIPLRRFTLSSRG